MAGHTARATCQVYLVLEVRTAARDQLAALLGCGTISSVLLRPAPDSRLTAQTAKPLVDLAQSKGSAALLLDDAALARTLRADGVHLSPSVDLMARFDEARSVLGSQAIVGADAGGSRHIAMELGEAGAEYVAFSSTMSLVAAPSPDDDAEDSLAPMSQRELVSWWSDVFEVPCVAFDAMSPDDARAYASAGADFVAVTCPGGLSTAEIVAWFTSIREAVEHDDA